MYSVKPVEERKTFQKPTQKTINNTLSIKELLNPKVEEADDANTVLAEMNESFTEEDLKKAWNEYSLEIKKQLKNSLYSTLNSSPIQLTSEKKIIIEIKNSIEAADLDKEKIDLLGFLRKKLNNTFIQLEYKVQSEDKITFLDSKAKFDKMCKENESLIKFQKLFNLDIDY